MSELDPIEATRREFEAVMALPRFATIEQVADGLGAAMSRGLRDAAPAAIPEVEGATSTALPSRLGR